MVKRVRPLGGDVVDGLSLDLDGVIAAVGPEIAPPAPDATVVDGGNRLLLPG